MTKTQFENEFFKTEVTDTGDYIRIKQTDKITLTEHKIILDYSELLKIRDIVNITGGENNGSNNR